MRSHDLLQTLRQTRQRTGIFDDNVGVLPGRLHPRLMHRPHRLQVLPNDRLNRASPLQHIAAHAADEAQVSIGVDKNAQVERCPDRLVPPWKQTLDQNHRGWLDAIRTLLAAMGREVVARTLDRFTARKLPQVFKQQRMIDGAWLVIVHRLALRRSQFGVIAVVAVLGKQDGLRFIPVAKGPGDRAFAASRTAAYADDERAAVRIHTSDYAHR